MAIITSAQSGPWSSGTTWVGGVAPVGTDSVVIAVTHTVSKDTVKGSPDCVDLTVNGTLAVGSNGIQVTGNLTGAAGGKITGGDNGAYSKPSGTQLDLDIEWDIQASSGNEFKIDFGNGTQNRFGGSTGNGRITLKYVDIDLSGTNSYVAVHNFDRGNDLIEQCAFHNCTDAAVQTNTQARHYEFYNCYFYNNAFGLRANTGGQTVMCFDCTFSYDRSDTLDTNSVADVQAFRTGAYVECHNCKFGAPIEIIAPERMATAWSHNHNLVLGDWVFVMDGGEVRKSAAAKRNGDFGIEFIPRSVSSKVRTVWVDVPIPCESGDSFSSFSIYAQIVSAGSDFNGSAGDITLELDPGNGWGLNETQEPSYATEDSWQQITFTGGTAGGTSKKGSAILRVHLNRYVASSKLYLADMAGTP